MKSFLLCLTSLLILTVSTTAYSDSPYTNEFKEELCTSMLNQLPISIPRHAYYIDEGWNRELRFVNYYYSDARSYDLEKECSFSNETDISLDIDVALSMERWRYKTNFAGQISCIFSSQYEWHCGYSSIRQSDSTIEKRVRYADADPQDGVDTYVMPYTDVQWQEDLLKVSEDKLSEFY